MLSALTVEAEDDLLLPPRQLFADYLDVSAILSRHPTELDFVVPGLLVGTLGMLVSPGGAGKSMLALQTAISIAAGRDFWGLYGEHPPVGTVVIVNAEDPPDILAHRLHSVAAAVPGLLSDPEVLARLRIKSVYGRGFSFGEWNGTRFTASEDLLTLEQELMELRARLVTIDTMNRCLAGLSENDNAAMGRVLAELERILAACGAAGLVLHHTSKSASLGGQGDHQQAARGASAITDNARWQSNLVTMSADDAEARNIAPEERRRWVRFALTKVNYAPPQADQWLYREAGGVLEGRDPPLPREGNGGKKKRERDYA
ncbi:helicase RepA family protein [Azospirillum sp. B510]|uniref:helicase RepA family protein n=1 Tax=Azospirillum sp. (strain B510) TaxID=137722 RepID=UPI000302F5E2|nr:helicase RepA family protein [Azospirillum sp. B510]